MKQFQVGRGGGDSKPLLADNTLIHVPLKSVVSFVVVAVSETAAGAQGSRNGPRLFPSGDMRAKCTARGMALGVITPPNMGRGAAAIVFTRC